MPNDINETKPERSSTPESPEGDSRKGELLPAGNPTSRGGLGLPTDFVDLIAASAGGVPVADDGAGLISSPNLQGPAGSSGPEMMRVGKRRETVKQMRARRAANQARYKQKNSGTTKAIVVSAPDYDRLKDCPRPRAGRDRRDSAARINLEAFVLSAEFKSALDEILARPASLSEIRVSSGKWVSPIWTDMVNLAQRHNVVAPRAYFDDLMFYFQKRKNAQNFDFEDIKNDRSRTCQLSVSTAIYKTLNQTLRKVDQSGGKNFVRRTRRPSVMQLVECLLRSDNFARWVASRRELFGAKRASR